jgi:predicted Zn-dependent peptidase
MNIKNSTSNLTRMIRLSSLFLVLVVAISTSLQAQVRWDELTYPEIKSFNKPNVTTFSLNNGIKVYLLEDNELPVINLNTRVRTGSILDPADKTGLASLTGTVMRTGGSAKHPGDDLNTLLEDRASILSVSIGFSSGSANLNTLKEDFAQMLPVYIDVMMNPAFPEDKIELAIRQSKSGISRRNDDPQGVANREFNSLIYGENSVYSSEVEYATLDNIVRDDLIAFHRKSFVGSNMMVSVTGDFKTADMRKLIETHFGSIGKGTPIVLEFPDVNPVNDATVNLVDKKDSQQSVVLMGHDGGLRQDPDYAALQVMNQVLAGGFTGRLFKKVRTDMGLAYAVFGEYASNLNYKGTFYTGVMTKSETTAEAIDAIKAEIIRLQEEPVGDEELKLVKDQFLNSLAFRYTSLASVLGEQLNNEYNGLPADLFDTFVEEVKAVTAADIQRVAQEKIRPDELQILVVGNKQTIGNQLDKYGEVREIDITIPQPNSSAPKAETEGDAEGQEWLNKMADAVVTPGTNFRGIETTGKVSQGPMALDAVSTIIFPDEMTTLISSPMGQIQQVYKDGVAIMKIGEQEQNLGEAGADEIQSTIDTHYIGLALKKGSLKASYLGMEDVDGTSYAKITINAGPGITMWINPATNLPARMSMMRFIPQMGSEVTIMTEYKDWNSQDGIQVAFSNNQFLDGNPAGGATYTSFKVVK